MRQIFAALAFSPLPTSTSAQPPPAGTPTEQLAKPPADAKVWAITSSGGAARHGQVSLWTTPDGTHWSRYRLNLRGVVSDIDEQNRFAPDGSLQNIVTRGD